jgi:hypothetical protein
MLYVMLWKLCLYIFTGDRVYSPRLDICTCSVMTVIFHAFRYTSLNIVYFWYYWYILPILAVVYFSILLYCTSQSYSKCRNSTGNCGVLKSRAVMSFVPYVLLLHVSP